MVRCIYIDIAIGIAIDTVRWVSMDVLTVRCVVCGVSSGCLVRWDIYIDIDDQELGMVRCIDTYIYIYIYIYSYLCKL